MDNRLRDLPFSIGLVYQLSQPQGETCNYQINDQLTLTIYIISSPECRGLYSGANRETVLFAVKGRETEEMGLRVSKQASA